MTDRRLLTIDIGNTRVKVSLYSGLKRLASIGSSDDVSFTDLRRIVGDIPVAGAICCSVGRPLSQDLSQYLFDITGRVPLSLSPDTPVPIGVSYASRFTLGADRVAAATGAATLFNSTPLLVVDAGTAVTLDVVDEAGVFRGGNISPGVSMRLRAMHEFTASLPLANAEGPVPEFGRDTLTAMRSGAVRGTCAEIAGSFGHARRLYGASRVLLTGGDASLLSRYVDIPSDCVTVVPDLVDIGLISIFNFNESL